MSLRSLFGLAVLTQMLACAAFTDPDDDGPPDDRGVHLADVNEAAKLTWSPDGAEVYFVANQYILRAVPAGGGTVRTLYSSTSSISHVVAVGNRLYLTAYVSAAALYEVVRIDAATGTSQRVLTFSGPLRSHLFAISADERYVATGDSLFDLVAATRRPLPVGNPWSFSPDGSHLLMQLQQANSVPQVVLISTSDLSVQAFPEPEHFVGRLSFGPGAHFWQGADPKVLRVVTEYEHNQVKAFVADVRTGTNREIATIPLEGGLFLDAATISSDGERVAVALGPFRWNKLHAIDTETLSRSVIATVSGNQGPMIASVALSPDGNQAAYVLYEGGGFSSRGFAKVYVSPTF